MLSSTQVNSVCPVQLLNVVAHYLLGVNVSELVATRLLD